MLYKVTLYASDKAGSRFKLVWLVDGKVGRSDGGERNDVACRKYIEAGLDADKGNGYVNRDWHVDVVEYGVYALPVVVVVEPKLMPPHVVSGDGGSGC